MLHRRESLTAAGLAIAGWPCRTVGDPSTTTSACPMRTTGWWAASSWASQADLARCLSTTTGQAGHRRLGPGAGRRAQGLPQRPPDPGSAMHHHV